MYLQTSVGFQSQSSTFQEFRILLSDVLCACIMEESRPLIPSLKLAFLWDLVPQNGPHWFLHCHITHYCWAMVKWLISWVLETLSIILKINLIYNKIPRSATPVGKLDDRIFEKYMRQPGNRREEKEKSTSDWTPNCHRIQYLCSPIS